MSKYLIAKLLASPTDGIDGIPKQTYSLFRTAKGYKLQLAETYRDLRRSQSRSVEPHTVEPKLQQLSQATLPAIPIGPTVCGGTALELTIFNGSCRISMSWQSNPGKGAEAFGAFADWLQELAPMTPFQVTD